MATHAPPARMPWTDAYRTLWAWIQGEEHPEAHRLITREQTDRARLKRFEDAAEVLRRNGAPPCVMLPGYLVTFGGGVLSYMRALDYRALTAALANEPPPLRPAHVHTWLCYPVVDGVRDFSRPTCGIEAGEPEPALPGREPVAVPSLCDCGDCVAGRECQSIDPGPALVGHAWAQPDRDEPHCD